MRFLAGLTGLLFAMVCAMVASPVQAQSWSAGEEIIEARLLADREIVAPGDRFHLGIHQIMPEGWHTYWRNPGDNGLPIELEWQVPDGVMIGDVIWPAPVELPLAGFIMDYGYKDEVTLPLPITVSEDFTGDQLEISVKAFWLVCEEVCIPEDRELSLTLPVAAEGRDHPVDYWYVQASLDAEPQPDERVRAELNLASQGLVLTLTGGDLVDPAVEWRELKFFPFDKDLIEHAAEQRLDRGAEKVRLVMEPSWGLSDGLRVGHGGVVSYEVAEAGSWQTRYIEIWAEPGEDTRPISMAAADTVQADAGLALLLLLAFGGGLILNLMPCVFPILSIKALSFVEIAHEDPARIRRHGLLFMAGVVLSFVALALLLVGLREFGLPVGWGFQLQTPVVVAVLAMLFFAIGLNLLGMFEVGTGLQNVGGSLTDGGGGRAAFFTGVLAVVVAAPCVGPLAAGALGAALTQPALIVVLVSAAMGLGLAAPFVLFSFLPNLLRYMPKPGAWMDTFKQALAFPMFASALWLAWVLTIQSGPAGILFLGMGMLALTLAIWSGRRTGRVWAAISTFALIATLASTLWVARLPAASSTQHMAADERAWSRTLVAELQADGQAVFIDVTAAWCVTCQVNKVRVLDDADVNAAFAQYNVAKLRADWTNRDADIAELIAQHGQAGVPLYLLYPASGGPAQVLPTVLMEESFIAALEAAARS